MNRKNLNLNGKIVVLIPNCSSSNIVSSTALSSPTYPPFHFSDTAEFHCGWIDTVHALKITV